MLLSLDSETNGIDVHISCKPFCFTLCEQNQEPVYYLWPVNPLTREPIPLQEDIEEIESKLEEADEIVMQNSKFDIRSASTIGIKWQPHWWSKLNDTLYSAHLLGSGQPHDLNSQALIYLGIDISQYEQRLKKACNEARGIARRDFPNWLIAKEDNPLLPSAKGESLASWDFWLPREIARAKKYPPEHPWWNVLTEYACIDPAVTLPLWLEHKRLMEERGLWKVYLERRKLIKIIYDMESRGVTYNQTRLEEMRTRFKAESAEDERICLEISGLDKLPKSGTSKAMRKLLFEDWKLPPLKRSKKTNEPSVDRATLKTWADSQPALSKPARFITRLLSKRQKDTACAYMESYKRFGQPSKYEGYGVLHPSLNATGTRTLRFSCQNPNTQNVGKRDEVSLRYIFGPAPGREWWSCDFSNLELRLPAYRANEKEMIALFEKPDEPPYFGSQHMLTSHVLWPKEFEECVSKGEEFNKKYKATLYAWIKAGSFANTYGAMEISGTADRAFHQSGAQAKIKARFKNIEKLNQECIAFAQEHGYVFTIPDKEVGGYPLEVPYEWGGKVKGTVPLNTVIQGCACWIVCRAMVRVDAYLDTLVNHFMILNVHDELCFDFPKGRRPDSNLHKILEIKRLMEQSGDDVGIPLRVDYAFHPSNWGEEVKL